MYSIISKSGLIRALLLWIVVLDVLQIVEGQFGIKKRREARFQASEVERLKNYVVVLGLEIRKSIFYTFTTLLAAGLGVFYVYGEHQSGLRGNRAGVDGTIDVVVVGCGLPKKGMGWFHLTQLLDMENVNVRAVVEPFFMNEELCPKVPELWNELETSLTELGVEVVKSVKDLGSLSKRTTLCLIAGRTHDNPSLFSECVALGASSIYLEKPGAPSVEALQDMESLAIENEVKVYLGYNKNVTPYIQQAVQLSKVTPNAHIFFCHNNSYTQADLPEVFSRNPEGLLKNMAIHELAILVTFFELTVESIQKFKVNASKLFSEKLSVWKPGTSLPNPEYLTDFSRCAFKITMKNGRILSLMADRCGGNVSFAVVKDESGKEVKKFEFPDEKTQAAIEEKVMADPEMMPYFFVQADDYMELKNLVVNAVLNNTEAEGVVTIQNGIEALRVAEYATEALNKALKNK